jgi:DNA-binding PadR family transcriptional regulator
MAKKRPVSNLMALGVLSTVVLRDMHPYEMAGALRGWGKDQDLPIKWGSLYTVVRNLARHGLIEEVSSGREGRRPERTVYRITAAGRAELVDWTRELLSAVAHETPRFRAGLSVMSALSPGEVRTLLQQRLAEVAAAITAAEESLRQYAEVPRLFLIEIEYDIAMLRAEASWMTSLIAELTAGTFSGIEQWRHYHETGDRPAELVELAEKAIDRPGEHIGPEH